MQINKLFFLLALSLLTGCARKINIKTTAYTDPRRLSHGFEKKKSFCLAGVSCADGISQNNDELQTKELEKKISIMLEDKGYLIDQNKLADYFLVFNYGCDAETIRYNSLKYLPGPVYKTDATLVDTFGYHGHYNQTTTSSGTYVYVPEQSIYYTKRLSILIYDKAGAEKCAKNPQAPSPHVWSGSSRGVDEYDDLRTYLDYLLVSMFNLFGGSGERTDIMYEGNDGVKNLRQKMASTSN